jgi:hypothetical protein
MSASLSKKRFESFTPQLDIALRRFPRLLLEDMQHIHRLTECRNVEDAMCDVCVHPYLANTGPDSRHRLPVCRIETPLNTPQLEARNGTGGDRKGSDVTACAPHPDERLVGHSRLYNYLYVRGKPEIPDDVADHPNNDAL